MANRTIACPKLFELPPPPAGKTGWPWTEETPSLMVNRPDGVPWPRISIVSPSYNQWKYLEENIRSVLLQGYPDIEVIIHDGGSDNQVLDIFRKYEQWISYWVSEPDRGQSHAVNKGILRSTGEIIFWLNSDDLVLPGAFRAAADAFITNPETGLVSGQAYVIDAHSRIVGNLKSYFTDWEETVTNPGNSLRQVSTFFRRKLFDDTGLLDENPNLAMDTDLLVRMTENHNPVVLEMPLASFRVHEEANTQTMLLKWYEENDRTRGKYLHTPNLQRRYHRRSSRLWVGLANKVSYSHRERRICLENSLKNNYTVLFSRDFWKGVRLQFTREK